MNRGVGLLLAFALSACLPAPRPQLEWIPAPLDQAREAPDSRGRIEKGDVVRVMTIDGNKDVFDIHKVEKDGFLGVSMVDHRTHRVAYTALKQMEVRRWGVGLTRISLEP